ncbi:MAG TPA: serine hydrolase [Pyrinomonadaceae bacterium]|jgi:CubicO group peptidase (beta-lactamase class C family)
MNKTFSQSILSFLLIVSIFTVSLPQIGYAQTSAQTQVSNDLARQLQTIEEKVEARRKELGIPGMSLAIVRDDQVIYAKGLGYKDFEKQVPVTADTQFAIGSATKAFTALSVLMTQDEGKLSLDDSPKKYLPYFKMKDAETDARISVRDLLSHSSGLNRTDLAMITGKLNRAELIQVAGEAKPTARLREKFQYQNIMFTAAGEIVAQTQKMPWEKFVPERIFKPLGMTNSTMSMGEMQKAKDYSFGYDYNFDTKETRRLPFRDIDEVAPAGSINSSAKDMAQWLRFVLGGGSSSTTGGKRLVSEKSFEEWLKPQQKISPNGKFNYSLGWFLQEWNGLKVVQHGGNIDGFNALVAMIPEKKIGFVMLTNVSGSSLGSELMPIVWENILGKPNATTGGTTIVAPEKEAGKYKFEAAGFDLEVRMENGKLVAVVPNQPTYVLENVGGRKYKLTNAPEGFFITFREKDAYLEQPQGNYTLPKAIAEITNAAPNPANNPARELIGKYETPSGKSAIEVKEVDGKVALVVSGQPPYELRVKDKDVFNSPLLPDAYSVKVTRDAGGKLAGIVLVQPEGEFPFKYAGAGEKPDAPKVSVDEVLAKAVNALGGEANWRKISSREMKYDIDFEHQGVKGSGTTFQKAPNLFANDTTFTALGKPIATAYEYFDGTRGGDVTSFSPADTFTGQRLEDVKVENDFYGLLNWKTGLKSAEVSRIDKLGDEEVYVVVIRPEKASEYTYFISTKTFLPLKKSGVIVSSTSSVKLPMSQTFSDYRAVDGVMIPYKTVTSTPSMGDVVSYIKEIKHNVSIDDAKFKPKKIVDDNKTKAAKN